MTTRFLLLLAAIALLSPTALAEDCNCSCASFSQLETQVEVFERQLEQGQTALVTPELQSALQCINPCAERWTQCSYTLTADPANVQTLAKSNGSETDPERLTAADRHDW